MAAAAVAIGAVREPWQLYLADAVLALGWAGTSLAMITNTISLWFDQKRGMAISLALNGASFGGIVGVPLLVTLIGHIGFASAMYAAAGAMLVLLLPVILLLVGRPPDLHGWYATAKARPQSSTEIRAWALRDVGFLTVTIAFALVLFAQVGFIVHLISFLDPVIGRERAAVAVAVLTAMAVIGRVLFSMVIDRLNQRLASALSFLSQAAALCVVINLHNDYALIAACAVFGFSVGNLITLPSLIVQQEFDFASFGVLISLNTAINQVTYAFGPGVVGFLRDLVGRLYAAVLSLYRAGGGGRGADHGAGEAKSEALVGWAKARSAVPTIDLSTCLARGGGHATLCPPYETTASPLPLLQQRLDIQPLREHRELAVRPERPLLLRPVPIELDAVVVGIAQIERLADAVVAGAVERDAGRHQAAERVGERGARRIEDRDVIEAGRAGRRRRAALALPGVEADVVVIAAGRDEGRLRAHALHQLEAEHAAIEGERAVEVGDLEVDVADPGAGMDGWALRHGAAPLTNSR